MDTFNVQFYANEDLAYQATKKAEIWGYVSFHANFSEAFFGRNRPTTFPERRPPRKDPVVDLNT